MKIRITGIIPQDTIYRLDSHVRSDVLALIRFIKLMSMEFDFGVIDGLVCFDNNVLEFDIEKGKCKVGYIFDFNTSSLADMEAWYFNELIERFGAI